MAFAADFDESNLVIRPAKGSPDNVQPLNVCYVKDEESGAMYLTSCWKLTAEELEEINRTKRIWVIIHGLKHPPITLSGLKPVSKMENNDEGKKA